MKNLLALLLLTAATPACASNPPYYGVVMSTQTGTVTQYLSGKTQFAASSGTAATTKIIIDGTTTKIGIGTTDPKVTLDVQGSVEIKGPHPWCDVRAFGAIGNGTTDDTTAVQSAVNACSPASGGAYGIVFFATGTYRVTSVDVSTKNVMLKGAGYYASAIQGTGVNHVVISSNSTTENGLIIEDLRISFSSIQSTYDGVYLRNISLFFFNRVLVERSRIGINLVALAQDGSITASIFGSNNQTGLAINNGCTDNRVIGNWFDENLSTGAYVNADNNTLGGNIFESNTLAALWLDGSASSNVITGNIFRVGSDVARYTRKGIQLDAASRNNISLNTIETFSSGSVILNGAAVNNIIALNQMSGGTISGGSQTGLLGFKNGSFGIGTTNPTADLDVNGALAVGSNLKLTVGSDGSITTPANAAATINGSLNVQHSVAAYGNNYVLLQDTGSTNYRYDIGFGVGGSSSALALRYNGAAGSLVEVSTIGALNLISSGSLRLNGSTGFLTSASSITASGFFGNGGGLTGISGISGATETVNASMTGVGTVASPLGVSASSVAVLSTAGKIQNYQQDSSSVTLMGPSLHNASHTLITAAWTSAIATFNGCVSNSSMTLTTNGGDVALSLVGDGITNTINDGCMVYVLQDGVFFDKQNSGEGLTSASQAVGSKSMNMSFGPYFVGVRPAAGSHTYCFGVSNVGGGTCTMGQNVNVGVAVWEMR